MSKICINNSKHYILDGLVSGNIWIASKLCFRFGLHTQFFNAIHRQDYSINAKIFKTGGIVFVELPKEIQLMIDKGYVSLKLAPEDIESDFDYIYELTNNTKIGFYKGLDNAEH
ncbi:hypothetical protein [Arcobacter arenosus]|uniref:Uncharacterized protein n=1 Tax=Arcobacter arenosus TaxID=2576037 RepID=A0A5R8Y5J0_9BACT|nr:hypothetical protein [Arcobacter arenosus]TLP41050.1 hypothetical protein FDK22_03250 [Arcobacter arenosus]